MDSVVNSILDIAQKNKERNVGQFGNIFPASELFPHQCAAWEIFLNSGCFKKQLAKEGKVPNRYDEMFLCWSRRTGKDYFSFSCAVYYCLMNPLKNVYYGFPQLNAAVQTIFKGSMSRDFVSDDPDKPGAPAVRYIDLIPKKYLKNIDNKNSIIEFKNGSKIYFISTQTTEKKRGSHAGLLISSEFCFSSEGSLDAVRPMIKENDGMIIMISTPPEFINHSYEKWIACRENDPRLFPDLLEQAKDSPDMRFSYTQLVAADQVCDQHGRRLVSDDFLIQEEKRMGKIYTDREYRVAWATSQSGSVFGEALAYVRNNGGMMTDIPVMEGTKLCVGMDLGVLDHTALVLAQINGYKIQFLNFYSTYGKSPQHYFSKIKQWEKQAGRKIDCIFGPHDVLTRNISAVQTNPTTGQQELSSVSKIAQKEGIRIIRTPSPRTKAQGVQLTRMMIMRSEFVNTYNRCSPLVKDLEKYRYKKDVASGEFTGDYEKHLPHVHSCDASQTLALGLENHFPGFITRTDKPMINTSRAVQKNSIYTYEIGSDSRITKKQRKIL